MSRKHGALRAAGLLLFGAAAGALVSTYWPKLVTSHAPLDAVGTVEAVPPTSTPGLAADGTEPAEPKGWRTRHTFEMENPVTAVAVGHGVVAAGAKTEELLVWELPAGRLRRSTGSGPDHLWESFHRRRDSLVEQLAYTANGKLVISHAGRNSIRVDGVGVSRSLTERTPRLFGVTVEGGYWFQQERIVAEVYKGVSNKEFYKTWEGYWLRLYTLKNGRLDDLESNGIYFHKQPIELVAAVRNELIATVSGGVLRWWCRDTSKATEMSKDLGSRLLGEQSLTDLEPTALAVPLTADRIAVAGKNGEVRLYETKMGRLTVTTLADHAGAVLAVAFRADGRQVVTGGADGTARVWDASTGKELAVLGGHTGAVTAVAYDLANGRIVTGGADRSVRVREFRE